MKRIINGYTYDTEKAIKIGFYRSELTNCEVGLYKPLRSRRYFLVREGHGMTIYRETVGEFRGWGCKIRPIIESEAFTWTTENLDYPDDIVNKYFAHLIKEV